MNGYDRDTWEPLNPEEQEAYQRLQRPSWQSVASGIGPVEPIGPVAPTPSTGKPELDAQLGGLASSWPQNTPAQYGGEQAMGVVGTFATLLDTARGGLAGALTPGGSVRAGASDPTKYPFRNAYGIRNLPDDDLWGKVPFAPDDMSIRDLVGGAADLVLDPFNYAPLGAIAGRGDDALRAAGRSATREVTDSSTRGILRPADSPGSVRAFHGTNGPPFTVFDPQRIGTATDSGDLGRGFYLSTDRAVGNTKANTLEFSVQSENPLQIEFPDWTANKRDLVSRALGSDTRLSSEEITERALARGFDSVELDYSPVGYKHKEIVVFTPEQARPPASPGAVQRATDVPFRPRISGAAIDPDLADVRTFTVAGEPVRLADEVLSTAQSDAARLYAATAQKADEPIYGGIVDALEQASAAVRTDPQGVVSRMAGKIPGLRAIRDWDRPGLTMEKRLLEGTIARRGVEASLTTGQSAARYDAIRLVDEVLGEGASTGARVLDDLRVAGQHAVESGGKLVEYPGSGTVYDLLQRPYAYQVGDDVRRVAEQWAKTDEGMRAILNERFGADIGHFVPARGGVYVPNVNVSQARQQTLENLARAESRSITGTGKSKTRVFETGFDRWANDIKRAEAGIIKPDAVFVPETDLRVLGYTSDMTKAKAAGDMTMRAATGGRTISEVKELVAPGLVERRGRLQREITSLQGRIQRVVESVRRDETVAARFDTMVNRTSRRAEQIASRIERAEARKATLPTPEAARSALDDAMRLLNETVADLRVSARDTGRAGERAARATSAARSAERTAGGAQSLFDEAELLAEAAAKANDDLAQGFLPYRAPNDPAFASKVAKVQEVADKALRTAQRIEDRLASTIERASDAADTATGRAAIARDIEAAAAGGVQDATRAVRGAQRAVRSTDAATARLTNDIDSYDAVIAELDRTAIALERAASGPATRADLASQALPMLRDDLLALKDEYADVKRAYDAVSTQDFVQAANLPGRYFPSAEAAQIDRMLRPAKDNLLVRAVEGLRSQVLAGDIGPLTGIQGLIAAASGRAGTTRAVVGALADGLKGVRKGEPGALLKPYTQEAMEQFIRENADLVQEFAFYTGRNVGGRLPAEVGQGGLLAKIPGFVDANEAMFNVSTRRQIEMFRRIKDDIVKAGYSPEEGAAAAADLSNKVIPLMTPQRLGQSAGQAQEQRFLPTSLGFIRQPLALTEEAFTTLGKMAAGKAISPREKLALSIYAQMMGNLMAVSVTTAGINALARDDDPVDAMLNALDPNSRSFMGVSIGGQTIPLANPFRSPLRVGLGTLRNILNVGVKPLTGVDIGQQAGASPIDYAANRIGPPIRATFGAMKELTAAPWERKYQGDNDLVRLLTAAGIFAAGSAPIPAVGIAEEVKEQFDQGDFDPARIAAVASSEAASLSLVPEEPVRTLDVQARAAHGVPFTELTPKEQSAILAADPKLAEASERKRRERVAEQLDESGFTDIAPAAWEAIRSLSPDLPKDYAAYRAAKMPALEEIARLQGNPDPANAAAQMFGRLTAVKQYRMVLASRRKAWALEHAKDGLAQLAVDYNFLDSNEDIRRILTAIDPVRATEAGR